MTPSASPTEEAGWISRKLGLGIRLNSLVDNGRVGYWTVPLGSEPLADRERDANARVLARVPAPFKSELDLV